MQKKSLLFVLLFIFLCLNSICFSQDVVIKSNALKKFISSPNLKTATIGVLIRDLETEKNIVDYCSECDLIPASVTKVITTATAIELLSDTFCFVTKLQYDGFIKDSILHGNVYILGGGDPTFGSSNDKKNFTFFDDAKNEILKLGVKCIDGCIVGDASLYFEEGAPSKWLVEDIGSSYSPTPSALSFADNLMSFYLCSDSNKVKISKLTPFTELFTPIVNVSVRDSKVTYCKVSKQDYSWSPLIYGYMQKNNKAFVKTEIPDPAQIVADSLCRVIKSLGIQVTMEPSLTTKQINRDTIRNTIMTYKSNPLKSIIQQTNYKSINLYAENIFSYLGLLDDKLKISFRENSSKVVANYWTGKGISSSNIFQVDGSGLSMKNAINSKYLVDILTYMKKKSKYSEFFFASLPTCGVNGTVKYFLSKTPLSGNVRAKSGSMERVQNYCGYINHKGKNYAFCIMINNFNGERTSVKQDISTFLNSVVNE